MRKQGMMQAKIEAFVNSLNLPSSQGQLLTSKLEDNSNLAAFLNGKDSDASGLVSLACQSARLCSGPDSVDTVPLNQTTVDANWSQACWFSPSCVVFPESAQDVSKSLKIVSFFQTKFAVRSGGHSPNPGWSSMEKPGVLIDLRKLNKVAISADRKLASLGPGGRWGDVFTALDPYDIALADGTITDANARQNSDLFWALKGGGSNFGIVTQFDLYTIPVKNIWYQVEIYTTDQVPALLDAFAQWQENGALDVKSTVALIVGLQSTTLGLIYSAPAMKPAAFAPFYDIPAAVVAVPPTNGTVLSLTQILGTTFTNDLMRHDYRGASSKIDAQLYKDVYAFWREQAAAVYSATGANMTFTLQPIPVNLVDQGIAKGGNPLGLPKVNHQCELARRVTDLVSRLQQLIFAGWTTLVDWQNANDDAAVRAAPIATSEKWKELGEKRGSYVSFLFMNDASRDQNPLAAYGSTNVEKLKAVSRKYDPSQVFQTLQNDGFLLSKL
ncbi:MAG: hypothetical protein Q9187_007280 [Circinaria calcarea]